MIHICLILHASRSANLGVGALTVAQVDLLREVSRRLGIPIRMTLLDWQDQGAPCVQGDDLTIIRIGGRDLLRPSGVWAHLRRADLVLDIGAGDSFADIYGGKRLRRIFLLKYLTHLAGRPLVLAPQTFGPFKNPLSRWLARFSIARSALVFSRDDASAAHLRKIGVRRDVGVASDVALRLTASGPQRPSQKVRVGLNVSGLLMSGGYNEANQFGLSVDYPSLMRGLIVRLVTHPCQPEVHLIPHVISPDAPVEDDMAAIAQLGTEFPMVKLAPAFATPSDAKGYISQMSFFTGARMHACIAAFSSGVAVVPMAYSRKFAGLFGSLGYRHVADCRTHMHEAVLASVMEGFENRQALASEAVAASALGRARLEQYEDAVAKLVFDVATAKEKPATKHMAGFVKGV